MAMTNPVSRANYEPNSWDAPVGGPREDPAGGYRSFPAQEAGQKRRLRPESFADHYSQTRQFYISQTGIERRQPLVDFANEVAKQCGYVGLRFQAGEIANTDISDTDLVVALHACDTATDDALLKAIRAGARWILVAPCCHKEVRPQMQPPPGLEPLFEFGIEVDRLAESVTDTLRALCLEAAGYGTRIQEFISLEHTHKNVLIMATKQGNPGHRARAAREALAFQARFGIARQRLSDALARELSNSTALASSCTTARSR